MFDLGMQEIIVIFIVALIVFGPKRLPELGRSLGKGINELKKAMSGIREQMDEEIKEIKEPLEEKKESLPGTGEEAREKEIRERDREEKQVNG